MVLATVQKTWHTPRMRKQLKERAQATENSGLVRGVGTLDFLILKPDLPRDGRPYKFRLDYRTFTASQVTSITGVSPTTQRDWRRRGIERVKRTAGWNRYTFFDLAFYLIMRLLTARGVSASVAAQLAEEALLRVLGLMVARKGAVDFWPAERNVWLAKARSTDRFIVAAVPDSEADSSGAFQVFGFANFTALNLFFRNNPQAIASVVVDLKRVVDQICDLGPLPLLTVIDETDEPEPVPAYANCDA